MERHPGQEEKHVWGMVGSGCAQGRRLGDEIRGLDWFGKSWEGQTTGVGFILWLWSGRGQAGIWAQEEDGWGAPPARALQTNCQSPGKKTERCYVMGRPQILWFDFSENWDEFVLNMLQHG